MATTTWEDAAYDAIDRVFTTGQPNHDHSLTDLYNAGNWTHFTWMAVQNYLDDDGSSEALLELVVRKQVDYGPENILKFGVDGIQVRLWDKVARRENLLMRGGNAQNESLEDTNADIVGYLVLWDMLAHGTFTLPLRRDLPQPQQSRQGPHRKLTQDDLVDAPVVYLVALDPETGAPFEGFSLDTYVPHKIVTL